ncbi:hypothetical protein CEUSTIGMA_g1627.t1 [Chlamydomonas eustigma]|uniref:F-box domain-containing protein n=1 Tax=Chlamydomonas eustigma TaxID=1157962 RepID=A0A250WTM5_9CHLO|nr:hypothetical protein CEUSTIGMA_g1627.t1 [Chlamydomonas eustigma]|eukprot:GAX74178.1 hypothetical protein CEUSTIGMA_g1627.t1 [Chlamydomonas eustigma]
MATDDLDKAFDQEFAEWQGESSYSTDSQSDVETRVLHNISKRTHCGIMYSLTTESPISEKKIKQSPARLVDVHADVLTSSPKEVLVKILSFLSADDLSKVAQTCSLLQTLSCEPLLWCRLFFSRWGLTEETSEKVNWKALYYEADEKETNHAVRSAPDELQSVFWDLQRAKRATCLSRMGGMNDIGFIPKSEVQLLLAEYRQTHGFSAAPSKKPDLKLKKLGFHRIGRNTFVCEDTGWAHTCDQECGEGLIDAEGVITCPVTGLTSQCLMSKHEERALQRCSAEADSAYHAADLELQGFSAARYYSEGYYADEREMRMRYGFGKGR